MSSENDGHVVSASCHYFRPSSWWPSFLMTLLLLWFLHSFHIHIGCVAQSEFLHADVTKWKHFPRYWPFVRGIHWSPVDSPHRDQWSRVLMLSVICTWTNCWANNGDAGDVRRHRTHYDDTVISPNVQYWSVGMQGWGGYENKASVIDNIIFAPRVPRDAYNINQSLTQGLDTTGGYHLKTWRDCV